LQGLHVVHVVPFRQEVNLERLFPSPLEVDRARGACSRHSLEDPAMGILEADEVVAAIGGRPEDQPVSRVLQGSRCLDEQRSG
jgi:hypothetical protein